MCCANMVTVLWETEAMSRLKSRFAINEERALPCVAMRNPVKPAQIFWLN